MGGTTLEDEQRKPTTTATAGGIQEALQTVFAAAPIGLLVLDADRRVVLANQAAARLAGRGDATELVGLVVGEAMLCVDRLDDSRGCGFGPHCATCPFGTTVAETLTSGVGRAGVEGWVPFAGAVGLSRRLRITTGYANSAGKEWVVAFFEDVTARYLAEEALRASEERYRQLVEDINDVIFTTDARGVLTYVNPAAQRVMGYAPEELVGKHFSFVIHPDDVPGVETRFLEVLKNRLGPYEFRYRHGSGEVRWARTLSNPVTRDGVSLGLRGVFSDITESRRLREQMESAQRMESLGQLAGGLAHDMNNILQAMMSLLILAKSEEALPAKALAHCQELERQIRRGAALIRQLLLFSRRETARREPLDLVAVVRGVEGLLRRLVRENVELRFALGGDGLTVEADQGQLEQVILNLVVNAADAMPEGGVVEVCTGAADGSVWLAVRDTGCGIPPEIRHRIFEPYFTTKEMGRGTGIGLAVVHGIITALGGRVEVESEVGVGSTFTVILPKAVGRARTPSGEVASVAELAQAAAGGGEHILLVEDEEDIRTALAAVLRALGYRVTAAGSAGEAGLLDAAAAPDVLLTDLVLPDASGVDLAMSLVERWPHLAVIMMSGYTADEAVRLGAAAGLVRFLQKPFEIGRLAEEIRAALDERG